MKSPHSTMAVRNAVLLAFLALPASGQEAITYGFERGEKAGGSTYQWGGGQSYIRLRRARSGDHLAEIEFKNSHVHNTGTVTDRLSIAGLRVAFSAVVGHGDQADLLSVEVPVGFVAIPSSISVPENEVGKILIYRLLQPGV